MKKAGILHAELARIIAAMGHGDKLMICDSGYPIPHNKPRADVLLTTAIPTVLQTLTAILGELHIESAIVAEEMETVSPHIYNEVKQVLSHVPVNKITHEKFKELALSSPNISFVRTGEATKFTNIILIAGVVF